MTRLSTFLLFAIFFILYSNATFAAHPSGYDTGISVGNYAKSRLGSKDKINNRFNKPLTGHNTNMQTLDNKISFHTQLQHPSTDGYLEVMIQQGGSGDLKVLNVMEDTNFDNKYDYIYDAISHVANGVISGVCTNGIISCEPGSWHNCSFYEWQSDNLGKVSLKSTTQTQLGGCYCINNACAATQSAYFNSGIVLKTIGGGAVAAAVAGAKNIRITQASEDMVTITYYGEKIDTSDFAKGTANQPTQASGACTGSHCPQYDWTAGTNNPGQYYSDSGSALVAASNNVRGQTAIDSNNDLYNLIAKSDIAKNHMQTYTCSIDRNASAFGKCAENANHSSGAMGLDDQIWINIYWDKPHNKLYWIQSTNNWPSYTDNVFSGFKWHNGCLYAESGQYHYDFGFDAKEYGCPGSYSQYFGRILDSVYGNRILNSVDTPPLMQGITVKVSATNTGCGSGSGSQRVFTTADANKTISWRAGYTCGKYLQYPTVTVDVSYFQCNTNKKAFADNATCAKKCGEVKLSTSNNCNPASDCKLRDKQVCGYNTANCVYLLHNYNTAFSSVGSSCHILTDADLGVSWNICLNGQTAISYNLTDSSSPNQTLAAGQDMYWHIKKTYTCRTPDYDFSHAKKRMETINGSMDSATTLSDLNSGQINFSYNDYNNNSGYWQTEYGKSLTLPPRDNASTNQCQFVCKIKVPELNTQSYGQTNTYTEKGKNGINSLVYDYRVCEQSGSNYTCPVKTGEKIVTNCKCINEFGEAATIIQMLQNAGKDLICSNGQRS